MKKLLGLLLLFIFSFSLAGCFNIYADDSKNDMDLVDVKVYDKDNNELKGTYKNFFGSRNPKSKDNNKEELNSAAPVFNYYCTLEWLILHCVGCTQRLYNEYWNGVYFVRYKSTYVGRWSLYPPWYLYPT